MTTLWEKVKAEIATLEGDFTAFEAKVKAMFESHAKEAAVQHITAPEQVSAAVATSAVLSTEPSAREAAAIPRPETVAPAVVQAAPVESVPVVQRSVSVDPAAPTVIA